MAEQKRLGRIQKFVASFGDNTALIASQVDALEDGCKDLRRSIREAKANNDCTSLVPDLETSYRQNRREINALKDAWGEILRAKYLARRHVA